VFSHTASNTTNTAPFVYRITAFANGVMPGSSTVLQAIWRPNTPSLLTGQWQSWRLLRN
jgi:Tfp pilus assembly protein PilX